MIQNVGPKLTSTRQKHGIVLLGPPGAGKGTQAQRLCRALRLTHISTGSLFRAHIRERTSLGQAAQQYLERGALVPDDLTIDMVRAKLQESMEDRGFVLDGFPRTVAQAVALENMLAGVGQRLTLAAHLHVPEESLVKRLTDRWTCASCNAVYSENRLPQGGVAGQCVCGGELYRRADDMPDMQRKRIRLYETQTAPVVDFYYERGLLLEIDGDRAPDYVNYLLVTGIDFFRPRSAASAMTVGQGH